MKLWEKLSIEDFESKHGKIQDSDDRILVMQSIEEYNNDIVFVDEWEEDSDETIKSR